MERDRVGPWWWKTQWVGHPPPPARQPGGHPGSPLLVWWPGKTTGGVGQPPPQTGGHPDSHLLEKRHQGV